LSSRLAVCAAGSSSRASERRPPVERARRLRKGTEFDTVYQKGTVVSGPLLVLRCLETGGEAPRWGFAVGKRIARKATDRNRVRRRLREAARTLQVRPGYDIVVTARLPAIDASYGSLRAALEKALVRAGLLEADRC
jgi:ribonuclease P protein component